MCSPSTAYLGGGRPGPYYKYPLVLCAGMGVLFQQRECQPGQVPVVLPHVLMCAATGQADCGAAKGAPRQHWSLSYHGRAEHALWRPFFSTLS